jgi:hypothetical protein
MESGGGDKDQDHRMAQPANPMSIIGEAKG